ncbi:MAG TPA: DUF2283 domain-containing protein [Candidatus Bathyarchaeia archaeon]|nr:DUF2283 domain-containing protein [Candidatus Bathyarchaeia archaeon]
MKAHYDPDVDILYLVIRRGPIRDSRELDEDIRVEYDKNGTIVGIEISNARKNLARPLSATIAKQLRAAR